LDEWIVGTASNPAIHPVGCGLAKHPAARQHLSNMKIKVVIVILALACVGLAVALFATKKTADDQHTEDVKSIEDFSNQVVSASEHLKDLGQVNLTLSNDLSSAQQQITVSTEELGQLSNTLSTANAALISTSNSLASTEELVTNLNNRIADLEAQNKALDQQVNDLTNTLVQLSTQIEDTRNQLAIAQTNRYFLQTELQKQLAAKAELEHKFNDLDELRGQVKRIKDEMFATRRLLMMKNDNSGKHGAELLISRPSPVNIVPNSARKTAPNYDLNVEIGSDGSVKVIPPMGNTNNAAH
jgi:septal ring factor EnvC (AmiA/AmiB activator)